MDTDFLDAHECHWGDAELLKKHSRLANADHLYGVSAECGLKQLMIRFGMAIDASGTPTKDKFHANKIWDRFETYRSGHPQGAGYGLPLSNPFADWNTGQRYCKRSDFDEGRVLAHREGVRVVMALIASMRSTDPVRIGERWTASSGTCCGWCWH